jgi:hypothetical protein
MNLTAHSRNRLLKTFELWKVPKEFADPMYNYLVHGYSPGSFFTAVLANDFCSAVQRSHPANTIDALKHLVGWMRDAMPVKASGSYAAVEDWTKLDQAQRRALLEWRGLIYSEEDEMMLVLQGEHTAEPILW